jgi:uncharacterized protein (TIGR02147 family)
MLEREFEMRRAQNPAYSLRAYARDLRLSPSLLSEVMSGRKGLSVGKAKEMLTKIDLAARERQLFLLSTEACHSRTKNEKQRASDELKKALHREVGKKIISDQEFALANNWYHHATLELTELNDCEHTAKWFAHRLGLSTPVIEKALERLLALHWLEFQNGRYFVTSEESETANELPSSARKRFHAEMIKKSEQALFHDLSEEREFQTMTLAFDRTQISQAKEMIQNFQREFSKKFLKMKHKNSIYQLSVQFFRLDKKGAEK